MDSINIYPVLITWQPSANGECAVHLSIDLNGKRASMVSIKKKIDPKHWDVDNKRVKKTHPNADLLNNIIRKKVNELETQILEHQAKIKKVTVASIKALLKGKKTDSVIGFFKEFIRYNAAPRVSKGEESARYSDNNIRKWTSELNRLEAYCPNGLTFDEVNVRWMEEYEASCATTLDKGTSLPITMSRFKQVLTRAAAKGLFDMAKIEGYKLPTYKNPERPYLTLEQTDVIAQKIYDGSLEYDLTLKITACFFLVECWAGLRFSDWSRFKVEKIIEGRSIKVSAKKTGEPVYVPLSSSPRLNTLIEFIEKNNYKHELTEQATNRLLKDLSSILKLDFKLTTHIGRHTCATLLLELGYSHEAIAHWLGISLKTVEIYAKNTRRKLMLEYQKLGGI